MNKQSLRGPFWVRRLRRSSIVCFTDGAGAGQETMLGVTIDITPKVPAKTAGFATGPVATQIGDPLEANIVLLTVQNGPDICLIALDLLYAGDIDRELRRWGEPLDLTVRTAASHTHYGPPTSSELPELGGVDEPWLDEVIQRIKDAIDSLRQSATSARPPSIQRLRGSAPVGTLRRRRGVKVLRRPPWLYAGVINAPDRRSDPIDSLDIIRLGSANYPQALLWSTSCHPTSSPMDQSITAEFIGEVRRVLRATFGELPILFLQGGAGDVRSTASVPHGTDRLLAEMKSVIGPKPWIEPSREEWLTWCGRIADGILGAAPVGQEEILDPGDGGRSSVTLPLTRRGEPLRLVVERTRLSPTIELIGVNAELMSSHLPFITQALGTNAVVYGYAGEVFGYYPRTAMVREGGYEVDLHHRAFEIDGTVPSDPDSLLRTALDSLGPSTP